MGAVAPHHLIQCGIDLDGRKDRSKQPVLVVRIEQRQGGCI